MFSLTIKYKLNRFKSMTIFKLLKIKLNENNYETFHQQN